VSDYATEMGQNKALCEAFRQIRDGQVWQQLAPAQQTFIEHSLRDFTLSGVALPPEAQQRFKALKSELSALTSRFGNHVLDSTQAWYELVEEPALAGLPETSKAMLREAVEREGQSGHRITLAFPSYLAIITHADDRALREEVHAAFVTRASDQGPHAGRWDNGP